MPAALVSTLAPRYIGDQAVEQNTQLQYEQVGMVVDMLLGRLTLLSEQLGQFAGEVAKCIEPGNLA